MQHQLEVHGDGGLVFLIHRAVAAVIHQVLVETQQRLEDLEKEEMVVGERLQRLVSERREIIRKGELELTKSRNEVEVD